MATGFKRAALIGSVLCVAAAMLPESQAATRALQPEPALEMSVQEGGVDFGEMSPASPPRTLPDAVYIAVRTQRAGPWNLSVAATGDFTAGEGGPTFPIGNLEVSGRLNGQPAPFQRCATSPVTLVSNGPLNGGTVAMDYRLSVGYDAPALAAGAEYRSDLVYTTSFGTLAASYVDPNPFDPAVHQVVTIRYHYSRLSYPYVVVQIFNSLGRVVFSRSFPRPPDGWYVETWDGRDMTGHPVPDGVYSYSITGSMYIIAGGYINVQRGSPGPQASGGDAPRHDSGAVLQLSACARPCSVAVGDVVTVSACLRNGSAFELLHSRVAFDLPQGVRPIAEAAAFEDGRDRPITMIPAETGVSWDLGAIQRGASVCFSFKAAVGPDARPGDSVLRARASAALGKLVVRSEEAIVHLGIETTTEAGQGAVVGRVFMDRDADGRMTEADEPAQGVLIAVGDAKAARSDAGGRFTLEGLAPGDHVVRAAGPTLPPGWEPRTTLIAVSVAPGETVRLDVPLRRIDAAARGAAAAPASCVLSGVESIKLEMGPGYTSWHASGNIAAQTGAGLELSLNGESHVTWVTDGERADGLTMPRREATFSGLATLAAPLARNARLTVGLSTISEASAGLPAFRVGMDVAPVRGLTLTASYDTARGSPQLSGTWEAHLAEGLALAAGADIARGGEDTFVAPLVSATYTGPSGVTGRLVLRGAPHPVAELACSLPLGRSLSLALTHRRYIGAAATQGQSESPADTVLGLRYLAGGKTPLTVAGQYNPADGSFAGSLLSAGGTPGGGSWHAGLAASFEPSLASVSLQAGIALPGRLEPVGRLTCGSERYRLENGDATRKLTMSLSCSVLLDERTTASGILSLKQVDDHSPPAPVLAVTRSVAAYLDRRVAPGLSLGAGGSWTHLSPGGLSLASIEARATYDIAPQARLVLGYRASLGAADSPAVGTPWQPGPYLRLVLAFGWDRAMPGLPRR